MGLRMFSTQASPIAIDFGSASVKLLQVDTKEKPSVIAAAELPIPDAVRQDRTQLMPFLEQNLPVALKTGRFKGRRVVFALPTAETVIQHMQITLPEGVKQQDEAVKTQFQISMNLPPDTMVVRSHKVAEIHRDGQSRTEILCTAISRDLIMGHVALLESCRLDVIGILSQPVAIVRAFQHIHRRDGDENVTTMYIDLGWSGTCVVIAHGSSLAFARAIQIGGRHFDQLIAKSLKCDLAGARAQRLSMAESLSSSASSPPADSQAAASRRPSAAAVADESEGGLARLSAAMARDEELADDESEPIPHATVTAEDRRNGGAPTAAARAVPPGSGPASPGNVDYSELLETIADELSMCLRYHRGIFPNRSIDRVILLGGEARQNWMCRHVAKALRLPARLGDPVARFSANSNSPNLAAIDRRSPQPGWATACGLCSPPEKD